MALRTTLVHTTDDNDEYCPYGRKQKISKPQGGTGHKANHSALEKRMHYAKHKLHYGLENTNSRSMREYAFKSA